MYTIIILTKDNLTLIMNNENKVEKEIHQVPYTVELEKQLILKFEKREIRIDRDLVKRLVIRFSK